MADDEPPGRRLTKVSELSDHLRRCNIKERSVPRHADELSFLADATCGKTVPRYGLVVVINPGRKQRVGIRLNMT